MSLQYPAFIAQNMEDIVAFNVQLASQALPQLYADGHRALALQWALDERLDPFALVELRKDFSDITPVSTLSLTRYTSNYASFFSSAMAAHDQGAIKQLIENPGSNQRIFGERLGDVARACAVSLKEHPVFSEFLFESLPESFDGEKRSTSYDSPLDQLASAACTEGRLDWLAKIQRVKLGYDKSGLDGWALARAHFLSTLDVAGCSALIDSGCLASNRYGDLARLFVVGQAPEQRVFALRLLALEFNGVVQKNPLAAPGKAQFNSVASSMALWGSEPEKTPVCWLTFYLNMGLDPFTLGADGTRSLARSLLGASRGDDARSADVKQAITRTRDDLCAELLLTMILAHPNTVRMQDHVELGFVDKNLRERFRGARKIDLLALCIGQNYYRCADTLVLNGFDPKFASQQCSKWLKTTYYGLNFEDKQAALAYCEALLLGKISQQASARRDAKMDGHGIPPPVAALTRRL